VKKNRKAHFFVVLVLTLVVSYVSALGLDFRIGGNEVRLPNASEMRFGIDIKGGIEAYFVPEDPDYFPTDKEFEDARRVFEIRLDAKNVMDREILLDKTSGLIMVRFPFKSSEDASNAQSTIDDIGKTARLEFKDPDGNIIFDGSEVDDARPEFYSGSGIMGEWGVSLSLKPNGAAAFAEATARLKGRSLVIFVDDVLIFAPRVNEAITGGHATITGRFNPDSALSFASQIKSGALPYNMKTESYSIISPTLGQGALNVMLYAGFVALLIIFLFILIRYRLLGIPACLALLMQISFTLMIINYSNLTLTLPGIAGIILIVGIGVDTNIVVIERIREELGTGKPIGSAINAGFKRALSAVIDSNVTSLFASFMLMVLGTGAIKSFGWTTFIGIVINFFTSILLSRVMTRSLCDFPGLCKPFLFGVKMGYTSRFNLNVYKNRRAFVTGSAVLLIAVLCISFIPSMSPKLDIQFAGGALFNYSYTGEVNTEDVARIARDTLNREVAAITTRSVTGDQTLVLNIAGRQGVGSAASAELLYNLTEAFPNSDITAKDIRTVDPLIGRATLQRGVLAVLLAAVLIVLYVVIRFRALSSWSLGGFALLAMLHDILFVLAAFIVFQIPLNDAFIAVLLAILGYSINDKIIIYDRIRENNKIMKKDTPIESIVDNSINQTMTRSICTTGSTLATIFSILIFASIFGIVSIQNFALPLSIGIAAGGYSSVFIAGPLWTAWQKRAEKKMGAKS